MKRIYEKLFTAKLKVPYAYQVAIDASPSDVNPLDFRGESVKIAFADLAKVMIWFLYFRRI